MSDDPFAAFTKNTTDPKKSAEDPFAAFSVKPAAATSVGASPFAAFNVPASKASAGSADPFSAFSSSSSSSPVADPFAAFAPKSDPFAPKSNAFDPKSSALDLFAGLGPAKPPAPTKDSIDTIAAGTRTPPRIPVVPVASRTPPAELFPPMTGLSKGGSPSRSSYESPMDSARSSPSMGSQPSNMSMSSADQFDPFAAVSVTTPPVSKPLDLFAAVPVAPSRPIPQEPPVKSQRPPIPIKAEKPVEKPAKGALNLANFISPKKIGSGDSAGGASEDRSENEESPVARQARVKRMELTTRAYTGSRTVIEGKVSGPFWTSHVFFDLFIEGRRNAVFTQDYDGDSHPVRRLRNSLHYAHASISSQLDLFKDSSAASPIPGVTVEVLRCLYEGVSLMDKFPFAGEPQSVYTFLEHFMPRLRGLRVGEFLLYPCCYSVDSKPFVMILVVSKVVEGSESDYSVCIVNTQDASGALGYHPSKVDVHTGELRKNLGMALGCLHNSKVLNTAFWYAPTSSLCTPHTLY